jgi:hypothetical protein
MCLLYHASGGEEERSQRIVVVVVGVANATCIGYLGYKKLNSNSLSLSLSLSLIVASFATTQELGE